MIAVYRAVLIECSGIHAYVFREPLPLAQRFEHDSFWSLPWVRA